MLSIKDSKELNCGSPYMIMRTINFVCARARCHLSCKSIILFECHIVCRILNTSCIKEILVVENYPERARVRNCIQIAIDRKLICDSVVCTCIDTTLFDIWVQIFEKICLNVVVISRNVLYCHNINRIIST